MKIHEYQAKTILAKYGVPVPRGEVANLLPEAAEAARTLLANGASVLTFAPLVTDSRRNALLRNDDTAFQFGRCRVLRGPRQLFVDGHLSQIV